MYEALFTPSFRLSRCCLHARACALPQPPKEGECYLQLLLKGGEWDKARGKHKCVGLCMVISSNEDMGEVCNLEKDMKMLIFRYLSLEYSLCSLFIITMHFLLLQIYHHHAVSPSTDLSSPCIFSFYRSRPICLIVVFLLLPLPWRYATDSGLNCFVLISRKCGGTCTTVWRMG